MSDDVATDTCRDLACDINYHPSRSAHPQTSATRLELRETAAVDADVSTVVQYNQVSTSQMGHVDAPIKAGRLIGLNIDTTMKMYESRVTIPSVLLHQDKTVNHASGTQIANACVTNETVNETAPKDPPFSSAKALKRKKQLSLREISVAKSSNLVPPSRSPPLSPPPENLQPPSSFPATLTLPGSPSDTCQTPENFSPSIVISTPTSTTPILLEPSRPIPLMAIPSPPQALPRIGTPQRPYYSTVRAHLRNISPSRLSTPSTPSSPIDGDSRLTHLDGIGVSEGDKTYQPSPTVPPSVLAPNHTFPSIPSQMCSQSSSPPRHILSALDPDYDDDDEEEEEYEYIRSGTISARLSKVLRKRSSLWSCLGRKDGRPFGVSETKSEKEVHYTTAMPALFPIRSFGSFGNVSGCSMSGEIEMRMALAERNQSASALRFRPSPRPNYDERHLGRAKGNGRTLMKIRSSIGLSSRTSLTSLPPSPSKHSIGSKLKEMGASFFSKFSG